MHLLQKVGSGSLTVDGQFGDGTQVHGYNRACAWNITMDDAPYLAPLDASGRNYQLSPILGRVEHETSCSDTESAPDVFVGFESDPIEQLESFPPQPARAAKAERLVTLRKTRPDLCGVPNATTTYCDYHIDGTGKIKLECALCVDELRYEHPDLPGGAWTAVPNAGTFDGNTIRITAKVRNATRKAITAPVAVRDMTHDRALEVKDLPPTITVAPGQVTVVGEWNSTGFAWEREPGKPTLDHDIGFLTPYGAAQKLLKVRPKPVVLVHGWASDASTWSAYRGFLQGESPQWRSHAVRSMDTDPSGDRSIFANADAAAREINALRESEDADHVDIVAHSMGGLISRAYIHRTVGKAFDGTPWVAHLVMLGTPNMGSPCANLVYPVTSGRPTLELTPGYVENTFNRLVTNRKGVPFSIVAGTHMEVTCYDPEVGDMVVGLHSALWQIADRGMMNMLHTSMTVSKAMFDGFVRRRLEVGPGGGATAARASAAGRARASSAAAVTAAARKHVVPQVLATRKLTVRRGRTASVKIAGERKAALDVVLLAPAGVTSELVAPGGAVAASVKAGSPESRAVLRSLRGSSRRAGRWTLRLTGVSAGGRVLVAAAITGTKLRLTATARRASKRRIAVTAKLAGAGGRARLRAVVRGAGKPVTIKLARHGRSYRGTTRRAVKGTGAGVIVTARGGGRQRIVSTSVR